MCLFSALAADFKPRSPPEKLLHLVRRTGTMIYTLTWHKVKQSSRESLQTTHILAMQGDIPLQMLAHGGCTAPVPLPAALPWTGHADLHSPLDGPDALPCLAVLSSAALHPGAATSFLSKFQTCTKVLTATSQHDKNL